MAVGDPGLDTLVAWAQYWSILATLAVVEVAVTRQVNRYLHIYISYLHIYISTIYYLHLLCPV